MYTAQETAGFGHVWKESSFKLRPILIHAPTRGRKWWKSVRISKTTYQEAVKKAEIANMTQRKGGIHTQDMCISINLHANDESYIILYYTILYYTILYCIILYYIMLCYVMLWCIILYYLISNYSISYYIILCCVMLCYIIIYHIISYYIILCYINILYYMYHCISYARFCNWQHSLNWTLTSSEASNHWTAPHLLSRTHRRVF